MQALNVVLKFTERCNLNCSYCYYFNGLDQSFKERPALLSQSVATNVVHFLEDGVDEMAIKKLSISIHGGEPLLMPKNNFISICKLLTSLSTKVDDFSLHLQTNGTLLDKEWIDIFREFKIKIGLSLDGPQEYHDKYRVYHSGHGSYNKTEKAIRLLQKEQYDFGILSVINPTNDPKTIYNHFIKFLGVKGIDFLWPDFTNDRPPPHTAIKYGEFISKIFEIWTSQDDNTVHIRFLNSYLNLFLGSASLIYGVGADTNKSLHLITIRGDGELSTSDELMSTDPDTVTRMNKKVNEIRLKQFFAAPIFTELDQAFINTPNECKSCCWERICGGGSITNRFNKAKRFNNPSVYCDGLKLFFSNIFQYLMRSGIPFADVKARLLHEEVMQNT